MRSQNYRNSFEVVHSAQQLIILVIIRGLKSERERVKLYSNAVITQKEK